VRLLRRPHIHESRLFYAGLVLLILLIAYAVAFILENNNSVSMHLVFGTAHVSLIWLILLSLAVGLVGGLLLGALERRRRLRSHERRQQGDAG
jgi:uncharacterized integral membrane protein